MTFTTRFAPSPTGPLHLGHAFSALLASDMARAAGGNFLLRIEDIDVTRARPEWETQIYDDLAWLGLHWERPVFRQSDNTKFYTKALQKLWARGLLYPCACNRRDVREAASAPQEGSPKVGPDGIVYPGTCRSLPKDPNAPLPERTTLRLDLNACRDFLPKALEFHEKSSDAPVCGLVSTSLADLQKTTGDAVLCRRDMGTSYHLSVVVDDALQSVTDVVRGSDLFEITSFHLVVQNILGLTTPRYHHHRLIRDAAGKRLAKRDDARAISKYRNEGATPHDIRRMVGLA